MLVGLLGPFSVKERRGNSIRILLQAKGLQKNGFNDFCLYSFEKNPNLTHIKQKTIGKFLFPERFPYLQKIKKLPCDIVHTHHVRGAMILNQDYILDLPSYASLQLNEVYKHNPSVIKRLAVRKILLPFFFRRVERKIFQRAKKIIVASESIKRDILKTIPRIKQDKFALITNQVEPEKYQISKQPELVVGVTASNFADNMDRDCLEVVYLVAKQLPKIKFIVVGLMDKEQKSKVEKVSNIELKGKIDHQDYIKFLSEISVFLNPYLAFWDFGGSKFKLLEAGAAGLAIVSSKAGAIGFEHEEALCLADTPQEIVQQIKRLKDENLRAEKGQTLRKIIEKEHNYITEAKKLINIYKELT